MAHWIIILLLIIVAVFAVVLFIAMFTEMGTKRKTGTMLGGGRASNKDKKNNKGAKK